MPENKAPIGIAIDAMGGDAGPQVVVEGVVRAMRASKQNLDIYLVGDTHRIEMELGRHGDLPKRPHIEHTTQEIQMDDKAASSLRRKKDSSIARGLQLQKDGKVQAFVSAGNTGAVVASSLLALGRLPGVRRPGIATYVPGRSGGYVLLDVGATKDCKPIDLVTFGQMGSVYAERILKRPNPRIGLLNIGTEEGKGNELTRDAYDLFQSADVNFVGNVESNVLFQGGADVAVCDGFVGNVLLKFGESLVEWLGGMLREEITSRPMAKVGALFLKPVVRILKKKLSYEEYGGAPLLGVDGITIICHGRSSPRAIENAVHTAARFIRHDINNEIKSKLKHASEVTVE